MHRVVPIAAAAVLFSGAPVTTPADRAVPAVVKVLVPASGIQPRVVVDDRGRVHLVYYTGDAAHGDLSYVTSADEGATFSRPIPVNAPGSAIATGTVRGAQIALGRRGRIHVAWNGSRPIAGDANTSPMLYSRLDDESAAFEPERNVMHEPYNIDGGGAVAADPDGHVYVVWHANAPGEREEATRRVWIARSSDDGRTFVRERPASTRPAGVCGCCGLGAFADTRGGLYILYRSASEYVNRDMYLMTSRDRGRQFDEVMIDRWTVGACMMTTQAFAEGPDATWTAWETKGQVHLGRIDRTAGRLSAIVQPPGQNRTRKHPALAVNDRGDVLLAWTEGTAWNQGGLVRWQIFDAGGVMTGPLGDADRGVPAWSFPAVYARRDGGFAIVY